MRKRSSRCGQLAESRTQTRRELVRISAATLISRLRQVQGWPSPSGSCWRRRLIEAVEELFHQHVPQPPQVGDRHRVLESRQRRLTGQIGTIGQPIGNQLEHRIAAEFVMIILIFVIGEHSVAAVAPSPAPRVS